MNKLILIDGHSLIFRVYYAFLRRPMVNSKNVDTSILFGFTKILFDLILKERPTHLAVAFDPPSPTFRHQIYESYKANRSATPELIKSSLEPLITIVNSLSIPVLMRDGYEADDVIGSVAKNGASKGYTVYMVTPDKDYGQLLSKNIYQYKPGKAGAPEELIGEEEICKYYGIERAEQVIDILTLWGDSSDNIPGVRGVGEVGAKNLVSKFGSIENIYKNLDKLSNKQQEAFKEAAPQIELTKRLITIETNIDIEFDEEALKLGANDFSQTKEIFEEYEFPSLIKMLPQLKPLFNIKEESTTSQSKKEEVVEQWSIAEANEVAKLVAKEGYMVFSLSEEALLVGCNSKAALYNYQQTNPLTPFIENKEVLKVGYESKSFLNALRSKGINPDGPLGDIELMHYLLAPERSHKLEVLAKSYLNKTVAEQSHQGDLFSAVEPLLPVEVKLRELPLLYPLYMALMEQIEEQGVKGLYLTMEMPLVYILSQMELDGVKIDKELLYQYSKELSEELEKIEKRVRELSEEPSLNLSSPKQLGILLYEKLQIVKNAKKTSKQNYSTDEETLTSIADKHPIVPLILEHRNLKKLLSTYIDPLPSLASPSTGKIHTTYNQALTSTGRLSSIKPNLQNIPIRSERGREIRKAFIASEPSGVILSADYSQIELRLMAHMSGDPHFVEAFRAGKDIHAATASKIFSVAEEELTREQRNRAKVANFGIIYGISAFGLSQRLSISRQESKQLIDDYFNSYPQVKRYIEESIERAKSDGFVTTLYGRKRYLPEINSKNPVVRGLAERNAINAPIQGSAADIIKMAMINVAKELKGGGFKSKMVLQVHDELLFDAIKEEVEELSKVVVREMEGVIKLDIPLVVESNWGENWLQAH